MEQLATNAKLDPRTVERIAAGGSAYLSTLVRLTDALGLTLDQLINGAKRDGDSRDEGPPIEFKIHMAVQGTARSEQEVRGFERDSRSVFEAIRSKAAHTSSYQIEQSTHGGEYVYMGLFCETLDENELFAAVLIRPEKLAEFLHAVDLRRVTRETIAKCGLYLEMSDDGHDGAIAPYDATASRFPDGLAYLHVIGREAACAGQRRVWFAPDTGKLRPIR